MKKKKEVKKPSVKKMTELMAGHLDQVSGGGHYKVHGKRVHR